MRYLLTYLLLFAGLTVKAQLDSVYVAFESLNKGELERARGAIDAAAVHPETSGDGQTWYIRGFIYKETFVKKDRENPRSPFRETSLESFRKAIALDKEKENTEDCYKQIRYLAVTFHNDAKVALKPSSVNNALWSYNRFRETMVEADPSFDLRSSDIDFKNALASVYTSVYEADPKANEPYFDKIKQLYLEVLSVDSNNATANYNLAILYYNKGVEIINSMDYDMDMFAFMELQEHSVNIFKQSLPFMKKAYELNPKRREVLVGLSGIYFSLNEMEKSEELKQRVAELDQK